MRLLLCYRLHSFLHLFMVQKLYSFLLLEQKRYGLFTSEIVGRFVYCVILCYICSIIAWD